MVRPLQGRACHHHHHGVRRFFSNQRQKHRDGGDPSYQYECDSYIYWGDSAGHYSAARRADTGGRRS